MRLENCPHCGGPGRIKRITSPYMHGWVGCPECKIYKNWNHDPADAIRKWNTRTKAEPVLFDREEIVTGATVQILTNSETGETSIGWWRPEDPPEGMVEHG